MINQDIERIVDSIIEKAKIFKAPVNVETICQNHDITLESIAAEDNLSGFFLVNDNNKKIIGYNKNHSPNRIRFTIAHELGHFQLHYQNDQKFFIDNGSSKFFRNDVSSLGTLRQEREANAFAAALLMPTILLEKEIKKLSLKKNNEEMIFKLSGIFNVSEESMKFRLVNLGVINPD